MSDLEQTEQLDQHHKYSGKIEGWLALYALVIVITPLLNVLAISSLAGYHVQDYATELQNDVQNYLTFGWIFDISIIVAFLVIGYLFFNKNRYTRRLVILTHIIFIIGAFIVYSLAYNLVSKSGGDTSQSLTPIGTVSAIIWLPYWIFSKRVKATFIR